MKAAKQGPPVVFGPVTFRESCVQLLLGAQNNSLATQPMLTPAAAEFTAANGHSTALVEFDITRGTPPSTSGLVQVIFQNVFYTAAD